MFLFFLGWKLRVVRRMRGEPMPGMIEQPIGLLILQMD